MEALKSESPHNFFWKLIVSHPTTIFRKELSPRRMILHLTTTNSRWFGLTLNAPVSGISSWYLIVFRC